LDNTRHRLIEWGDCDPAGIVFNPRYFEWFDAATAALFGQALGMSKAAMIKRYDIVGIPLVDTRAKFHVPCSYGDEVRIESTISEFRRSSFDVRHRLIRADGTLAVEGFETRVWVGRHPDRPGGIKARPIPEDVIARFTLPHGEE
jgi:4-hydroxybenzoyl-CoA thioesterase